MNCLVNVVPSTSSIHEKDVYFEAKLVVCNYLNNGWQSFGLKYECNDKEYEVSTRPIGQSCRSDASYELVERSGKNGAEIDLNVSEIIIDGGADAKVLVDLKDFEGNSDLYDKLKKGKEISV